jgi:methylated-DNA-[protein]-cysteine S-methyltransferase
MGQPAHHYLIFETAGGFCGIAWNNAGIARFQLPAKSAEATERALLHRVPGAKPGAPTPEVAEAVAAVKRYFEGEETDFSGFRLDLGEQDPFFGRIYVAARRVGWGRTTTYGALAKELGTGPEAARDVGQAMARNPVALIIPCHRVLAAGGKIGGFSAPGGSTTKMRMLALEGGSPPAVATDSATFRVLRRQRLRGRRTQEIVEQSHACRLGKSRPFAGLPQISAPMRRRLRLWFTPLKRRGGAPLNSPRRSRSCLEQS